MGRKEVLRYGVIWLVLIVLVSLLIILRGGPTGRSITGFAVFEDSNQGDFDNGTYVGIDYNGSSLVFVGNNLTGSYASQVFDATDNSNWNNLTWEGNSRLGVISYLTSALHQGINTTGVYMRDDSFDLIDMKDSNKNFYLNFSDDLINGTVLKLYSKKSKGNVVGIYLQSDVSGSNPLGNFVVNSLTGEWINISLNMSQSDAIWLGEGTGSGNDPKEYFDYIFAEVPGSNFTFEVRNCSSSDCSDGTFTSIDLNNLNLDSRYFQYKINFQRDSSSLQPLIYNVSLDYDLISTNSAPTISILIPESDANYTTNESLELNFTMSDVDSNEDECWYNIDEGSNLTVSSCADTTFDVSGTGDYTLRVYVNDTQNEIASDSVNFSVNISVNSSSSGGSSGGSGGSSSSSSSGGSSSGESSPTIGSIKVKKLELSKIDDLILKGGDQKTLSLTAKNIWVFFLNNCNLLFYGDKSNWIFSDQNEGIAPRESVDYVFDLNIPEEVETGEYSLGLEFICDEGSESQEFSITILSDLQEINVIGIEHEDDELLINYNFDNTNVIGESVDVVIWIEDEEGIEVGGTVDSFPINVEGLIERNVIFDIGNLRGVYSVYFALADDLDDFVRESIVLGKSRGTGFVVFDTTRGKIIGYVIFALMIAGTVVLFVMKKFKGKDHPHKKRSRWLLKKKHDEDDLSLFG